MASTSIERSNTRFNLPLLWTRIRGAALLNTEEVMALKMDTQATPQAVGVLVLAALSYSIGYNIYTQLLQTNTVSLYGIIVGGIAQVIISCFAAVVWSITVFFVGTKFFQGHTSYWQLARPMFFTTAPGILLGLIAIPFRPMIVTVVIIAASWLIVSQTFAVKQVMGFGLRRTALTLAVGFLILWFLSFTI